MNLRRCCFWVSWVGNVLVPIAYALLLNRFGQAALLSSIPAFLLGELVLIAVLTGATAVSVRRNRLESQIGVCTLALLAIVLLLCLSLPLVQG